MVIQTNKSSMADPSSTTVSSEKTSLPSNVLLLVSNLNSLITVKLESTNYSIWRSQIQNFFEATELFGFLDGSMICPPPTVLDSNNQAVTNPEFMKWKLVDSCLLSCLIATLTPSIYSSVLHLKRSTEFWFALEKRFTSLSRSHIHQLKNKLSTVSKKTKSMDVYLQEIRDLVDQLALACSPICDEDLILLVLNGLPEEYNAFKTAIRAKSEILTMDELCALLCSEAIHVEHYHKSGSSSDLTVAFTATHGSNILPQGSSVSGSPQGSSGSAFTKNFSFQNRGGRSSHYQYRGGRYNNNRGRRTGRPQSYGLICQICGKGNHSALECRNRMNPSFQPVFPSYTVNPTAGSSNFRAYAAPIPLNSISSSPPWYVDSAATSHLTNDLSNLQLYQPYQGSEQVMIGDGNTLPIHNSGTGQFQQQGAL